MTDWWRRLPHKDLLLLFFAAGFIVGMVFGAGFGFLT